MKAIILAGGFATRLWPLTIDKAKPLLPIGGKPMISHLVEMIPKNIPIIVSTNAAFAKDFFAWKRGFSGRNMEIFVEDANKDALKVGAARAISLVLDTFAINEDVLVLGGDNLFHFSLVDFLQSANGKPSLAAFDIKDAEEAKKFGVVVAQGKSILNFEEKPAQPKSTLVSTLCYYFPKTVLNDVRASTKERPDNPGGIFEYLLRIGREPEVYAFDGYWNDIGSFHAYIEAHKYLGGQSIPHSLQNPELHNVFEGVNYIEEGAEIRDCEIRNAIILSGSKLSSCTVEECIIDRDCEFTNLDMRREIIRQGTVLLNDAKNML